MNALGNMGVYCNWKCSCVTHITVSENESLKKSPNIVAPPDWIK